MNALDKLVSLISPEAGLKRQMARAALARAGQRAADTLSLRAYEGAKTGRRTGGWITAASSADAEVASSAVKLRDRTRALCRDNPYASRARDVYVANVVGTGITVKAGSAKAAFEQWITECDADGMLDFYGLQALVMRCVFESGECLIRYRERRPEDGLIVPLQLQVLEPDYLDASKSGAVSGGGWIIAGVEYNAIGQRVAYWLYNQHPGDTVNRGKSIESKRVPADQVLHIFERLRPGQTRGVPRMASILLKMRDLDDYEEAELVRKGIESCFSAIVTTEDTGSGLTEGTTDVNGNRIEALGAGLIQYLKPGQDIRFGAPANGGDYGAYTKTQLRAIAAGIGITYEQMTGDLSDVNYSSIRAGLVEFYKTVDMLQWHVLVPMMLAPIWKRWAETAFAVKAVRVKPDPLAQWTPPRRQWVDPLKDVNAARQEIAAGITSISETIRARGEDPERIFAEIASERQRLADLGIVLDVVGAPAAPPEDPQDPPARRDSTDEWAGYEARIGQMQDDLRRQIDALRQAPAQNITVNAAISSEDMRAASHDMLAGVADQANDYLQQIREDLKSMNLVLPAPIVNVDVAAPIVNVEAPAVSVAAPIVNVDDVVGGIHIPSDGYANA
ncbi:MAG: hypothetical protein RL274_2872, partial [Pseudomonadota bacterium]